MPRPYNKNIEQFVEDPRPVADRQRSMLARALMDFRRELNEGEGSSLTLRQRLKRMMNHHKRAVVVAKLITEKDSGK